MFKQITVLALFATGVLVAACGGGNSSSEPAASAPKAASARPSCEEIDHACDPYEDAPGLGKECHELAEKRETEEAVCEKRKAECLAACPPKK